MNIYFEIFVPLLKLSLQTTYPKSMKKKETLWQLLKRLDEQGGQFNLHLAAANRYFDNAAFITKSLIEKHEQDVLGLINKVKDVVKQLVKLRRNLDE